MLFLFVTVLTMFLSDLYFAWKSLSLILSICIDSGWHNKYRDCVHGLFADLSRSFTTAVINIVQSWARSRARPSFIYDSCSGRYLCCRKKLSVCEQLSLIVVGKRSHVEKNYLGGMLFISCRYDRTFSYCTAYFVVTPRAYLWLKNLDRSLITFEHLSQ